MLLVPVGAIAFLSFSNDTSIISLSRLTLISADRDSDGYNVFTIDPITGMIRTKAVLDHEERNVYRVSVKATDAGRPPRHSVRALRVEVLALADNRPTFTSSSLTFNVSIIDHRCANFRSNFSRDSSSIVSKT